MKKNYNSRSIFIRCNCNSELLILDYDEEFDIIDLSIYELINSGKTSLLQKIKHIYNIIIHDKPYYDQIILDRNQIKELKAFLDSI